MEKVDLVDDNNALLGVTTFSQAPGECRRRGFSRYDFFPEEDHRGRIKCECSDPGGIGAKNIYECKLETLIHTKVATGTIKKRKKSGISVGATGKVLCV